MPTTPAPNTTMRTCQGNAPLDRADRRSRLARHVVRVVGERHAAAEQVPIAVDVVDTRDRRPVFGAAERSGRIGGLFAPVRMTPVVGGYRCRRMRCVLERIVDAVGSSLFDRANLLADRYHRRDEAIELGLRLAL